MRTLSFSPKVITIDPVSRIEGHLRIEAEVDYVGNELQVIDARSTGTMFRGFEAILVNRDPWDAVPITERICGVCPVSHGMAASLALESLAAIQPADNGRILRNMVLGANYLQSHILHFYHLALLDYIEGPQIPPFQPNWATDLRFNAATTTALTNHYLAALDMRRKAHEAGAIFGGRLPHPPSFLPGGITVNPTQTQMAKYSSYLTELRTFITGTYLPDVQLLAQVYPEYTQYGRGTGNLLAFGVFDQDAAGQTKLFRRGRVMAGSTAVQPLDMGAITESVNYSWFQQSNNDLPPAHGATNPQFPKAGAYSWMKAPRYLDQPYEAGPLARMWINGDYRRGISSLDRHLARAQETLKVCDALKSWVPQIALGKAVITPSTSPQSGSALGLTEAPRGAIGHWVQIAGGKISSYQVITPTCWNASPRDTHNVPGPIEQALIGTPILNINEPIELLRVVHSFDPCMACAVHVMRPGQKSEPLVLRA